MPVIAVKVYVYAFFCRKSQLASLLKSATRPLERSDDPLKLYAQSPMLLLTCRRKNKLGLVSTFKDSGRSRRVSCFGGIDIKWVLGFFFLWTAVRHTMPPESAELER
jgi:hypothetical protein